jgi:hypothetical protein
MKTVIYRAKILLKKNDQLVDDRKLIILTDMTVEQYKKKVMEEYRARGLEVNVDVTYK